MLKQTIPQKAELLYSKALNWLLFRHVDWRAIAHRSRTEELNTWSRALEAGIVRAPDTTWNNLLIASITER